MFLSRRNLLGITGIAALAGLTACQEKGLPEVTEGSTGPNTLLNKLKIYTPNTLAFMVPTVGFGQHDLLKSGLIGEIEFEYWSSVENLESLLTVNANDIATVPTQLGAYLFNKELPIKLAAVTVWGMLYVAGKEGGTKNDLEQLKEQKIGIPETNTIPDLVFRYLLRESGIKEEDIEIVNYPNNQELIDDFLHEKIAWVLLPEAEMTLTVQKAKHEGLKVARVIDLQEVWAKVTEGEPRFPMAGVVVPNYIADEDNLSAGILNELAASVAQVNAREENIIAEINKRTGVEEDVITQVIPRLKLDMVSAADAKDQLLDFYQRIWSISPKVIGGKVPETDFFMKDTRPAEDKEKKE
ncbi:MAG: hypothetical protein CR979_02115 [Propionibacterium sp.]|nr:MAG: hypothetical protein CR979_02115 [Propionibacterium sp.]